MLFRKRDQPRISELVAIKPLLDVRFLERGAEVGKEREIGIAGREIDDTARKGRRRRRRDGSGRTHARSATTFSSHHTALL